MTRHLSGTPYDLRDSDASLRMLEGAYDKNKRAEGSLAIQGVEGSGVTES